MYLGLSRGELPALRDARCWAYIQWFGGLLFCFLIIERSLILFHIWFIATVAHAVTIGLILARRWRTPTPLDVKIIRIGYFVTVPVTFIACLVIWSTVIRR